MYAHKAINNLSPSQSNPSITQRSIIKSNFIQFKKSQTHKRNLTKKVFMDTLKMWFNEVWVTLFKDALFSNHFVSFRFVFMPHTKCVTNSPNLFWPNYITNVKTFTRYTPGRYALGVWYFNKNNLQWELFDINYTLLQLRPSENHSK